MDITAAIDVALGLVLMYLVFSLLCTTANEFVANAIKLRASTLKSALEQLIDDPRLKGAFDLHGLIDGSRVATSGGKTKTTPDPAATSKAGPTPAVTHNLLSWLRTTSDPSYLSGRTVALALIGSVDPKNPLPGMSEIEVAVKAMPDSNIRDSLLASIAEADGKIEKLRDSIATWFDGSMDRLSGAYKRYLQLISFAVGLVIAVLFNADTLSVGNRLWQDRSLAQAIAETAPAFVKAHCTTPDCAASAAPTVDAAAQSFLGLENSVRGFPIGWTGQPWPGQNQPKPPTTGTWIWFWLAKLFGLFLTAAALVMGAPFWFDILQKIMNLRSTGDKPAKANAPVPTT